MRVMIPLAYMPTVIIVLSANKTVIYLLTTGENSNILNRNQSNNNNVREHALITKIGVLTIDVLHIVCKIMISIIRLRIPTNCSSPVKFGKLLWPSPNSRQSEEIIDPDFSQLNNSSSYRCIPY